jgi:hypothetical protein
VEISKALFRLDSCPRTAAEGDLFEAQDNPGVTRDSNYVVRLIVSIVRNQLVSRFQLPLFRSNNF